MEDTKQEQGEDNGLELDDKYGYMPRICRSEMEPEQAIIERRIMVARMMKHNKANERNKVVTHFPLQRPVYIQLLIEWVGNAIGFMAACIMFIAPFIVFPFMMLMGKGKGKK